MEKHLQGLERIFIVGECPAKLDVIHIPYPDNYPKDRARNIYTKILHACGVATLSDNFVCASDDQFLLHDFEAERMPSYHCGSLEDTLAGLGKDNYYKRHVEATLLALTARGLPTLNFNVHFPAVYNKHLFRHTMEAYNWEIPKGYIAKSLFLNSLRIEGEKIKDSKIHTPKTKTAIYRKIRDAKFVSTNEYSLNDPMKEVLQELFPTPSRWEL